MALWNRRASTLDRAVERQYEAIREWRRRRFRILVCVDGSDESYVGLQYASQIAGDDEFDIILCYVRPIDQGLRTGGLEVRVARENMLEWGLELPGIQYLKKGLGMLIGERELAEKWSATSTHTDLRGDPLGDNKIEYRHESGRSIVLKLKTAPDPASGILDQYELGPYNLMILGAPGRWQGEIRSFWDAGVAQKVAMLSPCSVMIARDDRDGNGHLICIDGSEQSLDAMRRDAVLAAHLGIPITLMCVSRDDQGRRRAEDIVSEAKTILEEVDIDVVETVVRIGNPVEQIADVGKDHSLIVVSDSGKTRLKRFLVGSVAFDVMGRAAKSVLNVR